MKVPTLYSSIEVTFIVSWAPETYLEIEANSVTVWGSKPRRQILNKFRRGRFTMTKRKSGKHIGLRVMDKNGKLDIWDSGLLGENDWLEDLRTVCNGFLHPCIF